MVGGHDISMGWGPLVLFEHVGCGVGKMTRTSKGAESPLWVGMGDVIVPGLVNRLLVQG